MIIDFKKNIYIFDPTREYQNRRKERGTFLPPFIPPTNTRRTRGGGGGTRIERGGKAIDVFHRLNEVVKYSSV